MWTCQAFYIYYLHSTFGVGVAYYPCVLMRTLRLREVE